MYKILRERSRPMFSFIFMFVIGWFPLLLLILPGVFIVLFAPLIIQYVTR